MMQVREIWHHCFGNDAFCEWFFARLYDPQYLRVLTVGKTVVAMLFCFPREIVSQNRVFKSWYLYGIGTHPSERGKGYARQLIQTCISEAKEQGIDLCFLIPAEQSLFSYYERIGFSQIWTRDIVSCDAVVLQRCIEQHSVTTEDIPVLVDLYETSFLSRVCRDGHDWNLILEEFRLSQGDAVLLYENSSLIGYAFFYEKGEVLYLRELVLREGIDPIDVCHVLCKTKRWELTCDGVGTDFAMAYPLSKRGTITENITCDLLYN